MKAIRPARPGGPEVLQLREFPTPQPAANELVAKTEAIGVNFIDIYTRSGAYASTPPIQLGLEGAGVVEAVGSAVRDFVVGQRVAWTSVPGSYATHVVVPTERAVLVPDGLGSDIAAAALLQGLTAQYLTRSTVLLTERDTILIHAAAGGVGLLLVQMAKRVGARVFGTVSTDDKAALARAAGADEIILYVREDFVARATELTAGRGVDVVYDSVGKATFHRSLEVLRPRGLLVLFGQASGAVEPIDPQVLAAKGSLYLTRPTLRHYTRSREELAERAAELFEAIASGTLDIRIDRVFPLAEAEAAHRALESRGTSGKLLLRP